MSVPTRVPQPEIVLRRPPHTRPSTQKSQSPQCWCCGGPVDANGYAYRGDWYCEDCIWILADNGEFYCG
jgi:hypothetical protein